ncbi:MAG: inositol 2-dehydrogenase [Promethearchaeota archaeon]
MIQKIKVGLIGLGRIGKVHAQNLTREFPNVHLKAIAEIKIDETIKEFIGTLGMVQQDLTQDPQEIFGDPEINVVIITSSTDTHSQFIQEAVKNKKHVFCEKPIDINIPRIVETLKIVKQSGMKLMIGFNRRFDPNFRKVHELVNNGQIGTPHVIKITSRDPSPPPIDYIKVSGGLFMDMTIHDWDMAQFQAGSEIEEIYAKGAVLIDPKIGKAGDIDTAVAVLKFENGAMGIIDNSRKAIYGYDQRLEVFGSDGCLTAENETNSTLRTFTREGTCTDAIPYFFLERYTKSYVNELRYFFDCIKKNEPPKPNGVDGLVAILVAHAAQRSHEENRPVKISEIASEYNIENFSDLS